MKKLILAIACMLFAVPALAQQATPAQTLDVPLTTIPMAIWKNGGYTVYGASHITDNGATLLYKGSPISGSFNPAAVAITGGTIANTPLTGGTVSSVITDSSGQLNNVIAYGAVTGATDNTAAFNAAIAACPNTACTVLIPSGTYAVKTSGFQINQANVNLQCAAGAVIQAQSGFPGGYEMLKVGSSAKNVIVSNCVFDGNSIAAKAIAVGSAASNITVDHNEIENVTAYGLLGNLRTAGPLRFTNNYVHNLGSTAVGIYDLAGPNGTATLFVDNNRFDTLTGQGAAASGDSFFEASGNTFTNINLALVDGSLYAYGLDYVDWQHNYFQNDGVAIHCDTCGGGSISFNTAVGDFGAMADFFAEASSNITLEGNLSNDNTGSSGLLVGSGNSGIGPVQYRVQVLSFDATTGYTAGTNVALSTNSSTQKVGSGAMIATANSSFTTGTIWYYNFSSPNLYVGGYQELWLMPTSGNLAPKDISLVCSVNTNLSTQDMVMPVPLQLVGGTWTRLVVYQPGWQASLGQNGGGAGFKSCGFIANTSKPSLVIQFDEYDYAAEVIGDKIINNSIINPKYLGISMGAAQNTVVSGNYVENAGAFYGANSAFAFTNSPGTQFSNNWANFSTGTYNGIALTTGDTAVQSLTNVSGFTTTNAVTVYSTPADIVGSSVLPTGPPTITGCGTISAQTGSSQAGTFTTTTAGTCAAHLAGLGTAPHGWACNMQDITQHTATNILVQSVTSTTACTVTGTTAAGDVITFTATPY